MYVNNVKNEVIQAQDELIVAQAELIDVSGEGHIVAGKIFGLISEYTDALTTLNQYKMNRVLAEMETCIKEYKKHNERVSESTQKASVVIGKWSKALDDMHQLKAYFPF